MLKMIGGVVAGIFLGAMVVEITRRLKPGMLREVEQLAKKTKDSFAEAFRSGYQA